jgi:hypothetical protein
MSRSRAMRSALGAVAREPAAYLAEFVARWVLGTTALLLILYGAIAYARSLPVSNLDLLGLSGRLPGTVGAAIAHIFSGSGPTLLRIAMAVGIGSALLWWCVTSVSRSVTLASLTPAIITKPPFAMVAQANAARIAIWLLVIAAASGAYVFALHRARIDDAHINGRTFALYLLPLWAVAMWAGLLCDWLLTLEPVVSMRDRRSTFLTTAQVAFENAAQFVWVHFALGAVRFVLFWLAALGWFVCMSVALQSPPVVAIALAIIFVALVAAGSSLLQVLRVAAYARIVEWNGGFARID